MLEISTKTKVIASGAVILVAFAFGRYSASTVPSVKTSENVTVDTDKHVESNTHKVTVITEDCKTGKKITQITEDTGTQTDKTTNKDIKLSQTVTPPNKSLINISALASLDTSRGFIPVYGVSANKEFLGPITLGAFGLTNGVVGLSIGINF